MVCVLPKSVFFLCRGDFEMIFEVIVFREVIFGMISKVIVFREVIFGMISKVIVLVGRMRRALLAVDRRTPPQMQSGTEVHLSLSTSGTHDYTKYFRCSSYMWEHHSYSSRTMGSLMKPLVRRQQLWKELQAWLTFALAHYVYVGGASRETRAGVQCGTGGRTLILRTV
jgi:hypothetical protein